jgi:ABC-type branched-subunit amino acid transport system ATPase component/branched-subunit amino acid ABC-type transport system permease component
LADFLPFIVIGITTGAVYGLAGVGLVLTYKTSGIFNFAYGAVAALAVFVFYWLHTEHGMPWPYAAALCLFVLSPLEGLVLELVARTLENATATLKVVSTVGILIFMVGLGEIWYGDANTSFPSFLDTNTVRFLGVNIGFDQITETIISVAATAILYCFFRFVRLGVAMRGVVDNPELVSMTGTNPVVVRRWAWIIGTIFASMAGLLIAPSLNLDAYTIALLVVSAFGAAAIGYFSNFPLVFVGGLFVGVVDALATKYAAAISWLSGLSVGLPFIILFIVLIVMPRARLADRRVVTSVPLRQSWYAPTRMRLVAAAIALAFFACVPTFVGTQLVTWSSGLVYVMLFLSLGLLIKTSGQISLCHLAFAAVGAAAFGHFAVDWHVPWLGALLLAGLVAMPVGAIIAIPAIRLSGVFLALGTYGFGILFEQMFYQTGAMFGPTTSGIPAPRPDVTIFGWQLFSDKGFYYVLLVFVVLTVVAVQSILRGRMGRLLKGLSDSAVALETHGATTNVMKVLVFCITAGLAAIAGALLASLYDYGLGTNYSSFSSLTMVAVVVLIVMGDPWYAIVAGITFAVIPGYINLGNIYYYESMLFGLSAATFAVQVNRVPAVPLGLRRVIDRWGGRAPETVLAAGELEELVSEAAAEEKQSALADREMARSVAAGVPDKAGLAVCELSVQFGGLRAVDNVSLDAPMARITGLVGPNGAGKTTIFNACSGLLKPTAGKVLLHNGDVTGMGPAGRSRFGLGRTFQKAELFNSLSVRQNVALGREAAMAGANPITQLVERRRDRGVVQRAVDEAMELTGIGWLSDVQAGLLPTGQRRLVELARVLAGPFDLLLLDEPSAGLDATETVQFGNVLTGVVAERGTGILLVEHDMALVRQICAHIYMLDFGRLVFDGSPDEMLASDVVRAAYLGSEAVAAAAVSPAQEVAVSESVVEPASAPLRRGREGEPEC